MSSALVVVDVQQGMFARPELLYRGDEILSRIAGLLKSARGRGSPVIHIRHAGRAGGTLEKGSAGWFHHPMVAPLANEPVIDKSHSSAFHHTGLHERLTEMGVKRLVLCGMQTEMCVESTCRGAVSLDYQVTLIADAHTTYDTAIISAEQIIAHHNRIWGQSFADLVTSDELCV
jgi:nicotinamidase-related amidase